MKFLITLMLMVIYIASFVMMKDHFTELSMVRDSGTGFLTDAKSFQTLCLGLGLVELGSWIGLLFLTPIGKRTLESGIATNLRGVAILLIIGTGLATVILCQLAMGLESQAHQEELMTGIQFSTLLNLFSVIGLSIMTLNPILDRKYGYPLPDSYPR